MAPRCNWVTSVDESRESVRPLNCVITELFQSCIHCAPITHVDESGLFFPKIIQRPQTPPVQMEQAYAMTGHLIADINSTIYRK
jgi:hypothetical protein